MLFVSGVRDVTCVICHDSMGTGRRSFGVSDSDCAAAIREDAEYQSGIPVFVCPQSPRRRSSRVRTPDRRSVAVVVHGRDEPADFREGSARYQCDQREYVGAREIEAEPKEVADREYPS